jgi:hypothetical protein
LVRRDKEGHFILIKGSIHQEEIITINLYVPNIGAPYFIKYTLPDLKTQINSSTVAVGDFNSTLSLIVRSYRQKINKETPQLCDITDLMDLTDVYRVFRLATAQYTFFSTARGTFSKIEHT